MAAITASGELVTIAKRWMHAYSIGDAETVVNLLSEDAALGYIGSAEAEVWRGTPLLRSMSAYMRQLPEFRWTTTDARGFECGALGWVELFLDASMQQTGMQTRFRTTMVMHMERGVWKIVQVHNSTPVPNMQAMGYDATMFDDLLDAARAAPADFARTGIATIMFTDIADSTTIAETIGDSRWSVAVRAHVDALRSAIEAEGGTLIKSLGDGTMSSFPSARGALRAATAIQREMAASTHEPRLQIRIGLHTGDLVEQEGDVFGTVVNKAARVASSASPGEIRLSEATRIMVGSGEFGFSDKATVPLKGLEGEHVIHKLDWQT